MLDLGTVINNENLLEDPDHTIFHNVFYLGSVRVDNPKDEAVIQENMQAMFDDVFYSFQLSHKRNEHTFKM